MVLRTVTICTVSTATFGNLTEIGNDDMHRCVGQLNGKIGVLAIPTLYVSPTQLNVHPHNKVLTKSLKMFCHFAPKLEAFAHKVKNTPSHFAQSSKSLLKSSKCSKVIVLKVKSLLKQLIA
jgi:hypothetical protein